MRQERTYIRALITVIVFCVLMLGTIYATTIEAARSGNWSETTTWQGGVIPAAADSVLIASNHTVTVDVDHALCVHVQLGGPNFGTLVFSEASARLFVQGDVRFGDKTGVGELEMSDGLLELDGSLIIANGTFTATGGTVSYTSIGDQTITSTTYHHLDIGGSQGEKTAVGPLVVNGNFLNNGFENTFHAGSFTHRVKGILSNFTEFDAGTSTFVLNGAVAQFINGGLTFNDLTINNPVGVAMLFSRDTVLGTLRFISGNILLNNNDFVLGPDATVTDADSGKCIVTNAAGKVKRRIPGGTGAGSFQFPVGPTLTAYNPLTITLQNDPAEPGESFGVRVEPFDSTAPAFATTDTSLFASRVWTITEKTPGGNHANLTFHWRRNEGGSRIGIAGGTPVRAASFGFNSAQARYQFVDSASGPPPSAGQVVAATTGFRGVRFDSTAYIVGRLDAPTSVVDEDVPGVFSLEQNYPNPFNPSTTINFSVGVEGQTSLRVYDLLGREVKTLVNENLHAGKHETTFDASGLASGVYLYRLTTPSFTATKRLLLLR